MADELQLSDKTSDFDEEGDEVVKLKEKAKKRKGRGFESGMIRDKKAVRINHFSVT